MHATDISHLPFATSTAIIDPPSRQDHLTHPKLIPISSQHSQDPVLFPNS